MGMGSYSFDIKVLARVVLYARKEYQSCICSVVVNDLQDLFRAEYRLLGILGLDKNHGGGRIEIVKLKLRFNSILSKKISSS